MNSLTTKELEHEHRKIPTGSTIRVEEVPEVLRMNEKNGWELHQFP